MQLTLIPPTAALYPRHKPRTLQNIIDLSHPHPSAVTPVSESRDFRRSIHGLVISAQLSCQSSRERQEKRSNGYRSKPMTLQRYRYYGKEENESGSTSQTRSTRITKAEKIVTELSDGISGPVEDGKRLGRGTMELRKDALAF